MKRKLAAILAAGIAASTPALAQEQTREIAAAGLWASYSGTSEDSHALCSLATTGAEGRRITVLQYAGQTGIDLRLEKDSWIIPGSTPIDLAVQFDSEPPIQARATGSGKTLSVRMDFPQSVPFMRALRRDTQIRITFPSGSELPWTGGLSGSSRAIDAFNQCRDHLGPAVPVAPTQPYLAPPATATEPFSPGITTPNGLPPLPGAQPR